MVAMWRARDVATGRQRHRPRRKLLAGLALGGVLLLPAPLAAAPALQAVSDATLGSSAVAAPGYAVAPLPGMTAQEQQANVLWMLRSGLNVAALQCQFSPFLRTATTYNTLLRQHAGELTDAFETLKKYFIRTLGARTGIRGFDTYATRANQSWSSFDSQLAFCRAAADTGKRALALPRGALEAFAENEVPELRRVVETKPRFAALEAHFEWPAIPDIARLKTTRR